MPCAGHTCSMPCAGHACSTLCAGHACRLGLTDMAVCRTQDRRAPGGARQSVSALLPVYCVVKFHGHVMHALPSGLYRPCSHTTAVRWEGLVATGMDPGEATLQEAREVPPRALVDRPWGQGVQALVRLVVDLNVPSGQGTGRRFCAAQANSKGRSGHSVLRVVCWHGVCAAGLGGWGAHTAGLNGLVARRLTWKK